MRKKIGRANLRSKLYSSFFWLIIAALGCLIPFATEWSAAGIIWATLFLGLAVLFGWSTIKEIRTGNPVDLQLQAIGDMVEVANQIETAFSNQAYRPNHLYLNHRWLCFGRGGVAIIRPIDSLIWTYMETVRHRIQGIIPYRTTNQLIAWDRTGRAAAIVLTKMEVESALEGLQVIAPWLLAGYSQTLKESWNNDREELIALVDQRRKQSASEIRSE